MVIELTPEQEACVAEIAKHEGRTVEQIMLDGLQMRLGREAADRESILRGLAQADRGEFIEEEEMDRRVAEMLSR